MTPIRTFLLILCISVAASGCITSKREKPYNLQVDVFKGEFTTVNSFIFSNGKSLIVMDALRLTSEAHKLADTIKSKKLPLTHIFISHGHTDHFMGIDWLHKEFPQAKIVVANNDIKQDIKNYAIWMNSGGWLDDEPTLKPKSADNPNGFDYDNNIHVLAGNTLKLDGGGTLELNSNYLPTEAEHMTTVYSKDLNALFISDFGYNKVHLWMGAGVTSRHMANWKAELEVFRSTYTRFNPEVKIYPGHGDVTDITLFDKMIRYIDDFSNITLTVKPSEEAMEKMIALYPDYKEAGFLLKYSVENHVKP